VWARVRFHLATTFHTILILVHDHLWGRFLIGRGKNGKNVYRGKRYAQFWYKCVSTQWRGAFPTIPVTGPISRAVVNRQSARQPYLSWKVEIGRDWYRSQIGRDLWAKVEMCTGTPEHGLSGFTAIDQTQRPCTGVHIFTFAPQSRPIWLLYQSRPICLNKLFVPTDRSQFVIIFFQISK
jgi:hypothetical protein